MKIVINIGSLGLSAENVFGNEGKHQVLFRFVHVDRWLIWVFVLVFVLNLCIFCFLN